MEIYFYFVGPRFFSFFSGSTNAFALSTAASVGDTILISGFFCSVLVPNPFTTYCPCRLPLDISEKWCFQASKSCTKGISFTIVSRDEVYKLTLRSQMM